MAQDTEQKLFEISIIGIVISVILGIISFVLIFVNPSIATVFAIFTAGILISSCIFIATHYVIQTISPKPAEDKKK